VSRELKGWARSRPLRVAFLIEDGEHAGLALDGIFADCYDRWGGRFSLIAPCFNSRIAPSYWAWLEAYDPDVVYSYVPLSSTDVLEIHERLSPAQYVFMSWGANRGSMCSVSNRPTGSRLSLRYPQSLGLRVIVPQPARARPSRSSTAGTRKSLRASSQDSFGTYYVSRASGIYRRTPRLLLLCSRLFSPETQADRRYGVPRDLNAIPSELAAFKEFAEGRAYKASH